MATSRRRFIQTLAATSAVVASKPSWSNASATPFISCNQYSWFTFYEREKRSWGENLDASLAEYVKSGLKAFEPSFYSTNDVKTLAPLLKKYQLALPSAYIGSILHEDAESQKTIETAIAIAKEAKQLGLSILVTSPNPIRWGGTEIKSDEQLIKQAKNLDLLGSELKKQGITLAYHTHDAEFKAGAREFHHMLQNTHPQNVSLCLDAHWIYRGAGNSQVALFDIVKMYGKRVVELHIRQSVGQIWGETFGEGDIDYPRLVRELKTMNIKPLLVLEQCLEPQSPNTLNAIQAHQQDLAYAQKVFKGWV